MSKSFLLVVGGTLPSTCSGYVTFVSPEAFAYLVLSGRRNLTVAILPARMASGTVFVPPSNGGNIIQMAPGFPSFPLQASGTIPYPQYGAQQLGIPTNAPQQVPQKGPLERFFNAEPKVLGTVQIVIGLIHIGFGAASVSSITGRYYFLTLSSIGGYPFWGGIFFITSGSLCVSAANHRNSCLVKSSAAMNIISAIMSLSGICLHLSELIIYNRSSRYVYPYTDTDLATVQSLYNIRYGVSCMLLLFSLLEFCIAVPLAHFVCQATCCGDDQPTMVFVPYQVISGEEVAAEPNPLPPPPTYDNTVAKSE
ncbi:membrane-spanning 4-domains subfamily A member 8-like isoform X2 [Erythrolamprus reginae]|uniref:membrane-spanning 4-domains subfamily A member 8-like isoform X2 n=1 Tax=Erythrolamprus reginae TaxID=121349 RepID=UPI00396C8B4E